MTTIRRAGPADARPIAVVHTLSRADYYGSAPDDGGDRVPMWQHLLDQPDRFTYVAEVAEEVAGFVSGRRPVDRTQPLELTALYVHPDHFGHGVGGALYRTFEGEREHLEPAVLEVWAGNARAIGFYERRGWVATSQSRPGPQDVSFVAYRLHADAGDQSLPE